MGDAGERGVTGVGAAVDDAIAKTMAKPTGATQHAAPPAPEGFRVLTEHSAHLLFPIDNEVFYNNAQIFNRDLSVLVARLVLKQKRDEDAAKLAKKVARKCCIGKCRICIVRSNHFRRRRRRRRRQC